MTQPTPITLITYLSLAGIWRTRCEAHHPATGPFAPDRSKQEQHWRGQRWQCIACWMQAHQQTETEP